MKKQLAALTLSLALTAGLCIPAQAAEATFSDVPASHWAASYIAEMTEAGIMTGVGGGKFAPEQPISYAEFFTMLVRRYYGTPSGTGSPWWEPYLTSALEHRVLFNTALERYDMEYYREQDPDLPAKPLNRGEMAVILHNVMRNQEMPVKELYDPTVIPDWDDIYYHTDAFTEDAVRVCYEQGVLGGVDSVGTFYAEGLMTRAQAAAVMSRLIGLEGKTFAPALAALPPAPEGAVHVTQTSQLLTKDGMEAWQGGLHGNPDLVAHGNASFGLPSQGFQSISFTIKAGDTDTRITYVVSYPEDGYTDPMHQMGEILVRAGETRSYVLDCSGTTAIGFSFERADIAPGGNFAEFWIPEIWLS